jgi:hypothetical protein
MRHEVVHGALAAGTLGSQFMRAHKYTRTHAHTQRTHTTHTHHKHTHTHTHTHTRLATRDGGLAVGALGSQKVDPQGAIPP